jgi:hypothetical protein
MYFSQPCRLVEGRWKPFATHPLPDDVHCRLIDLIVLPMHILKYFSLGERCNAIWLLPITSAALKKYSSDERHKIPTALKSELRDMANQQKLLAMTTANKLAGIREYHVKKIKDEREQLKAKRFEELKRRKLISLYKERKEKEKESKYDEEDSEQEEKLIGISSPED